VAGLIPILDQGVCDCLRHVDDPELGVNIVDLGLVLTATRTAEVIRVAFTLTSRACPLGNLIKDDVMTALQGAFSSVRNIDVQLVWDPPWSHEMVTDQGFELLGMTRTRTLA